MRPVQVHAHPSTQADLDLLFRLLHTRLRLALRVLMVALSMQGLSSTQIADLLALHPHTVRNWTHRFNRQGLPGLLDRPRSGRPRLGDPSLHSRIRCLLRQPTAWTVPWLWLSLHRPPMSRRTLYRRVRQLARWRRPRLVARGDPDREAHPRRHPPCRLRPARRVGSPRRR